MRKRQTLDWAAILASLQKGEIVLVNEKKAGVLRSTFNRWRKKDSSRADLNLVRQKVGPDEFELALMDNKADAAKLMRKEQRRSAAERAWADKRQNDKERLLAKRINTAINRIPVKAWDKFFHRMKEIDGFQIAPTKVHEVINAFYWWAHQSTETKDLLLVKQMTTPDNFVRFYIAGEG
jgi:hypothetical protein